MAGYTRQSAADIVAGQVIKAAPVHNEFQQVQTAFAALTGHKHDGSTGEGGYVPLIADVDALNKVVVDTANNRVSFYTEVSGVATEQLRIQDGAVVPVTVLLLVTVLVTVLVSAKAGSDTNYATVTNTIAKKVFFINSSPVNSVYYIEYILILTQYASS